MRKQQADVAIVDYSMGNLFSVQHACQQVGLSAVITADKNDVLQAKAVILPGVGAFGDAMATLHKLDLVEPLLDVAAAGKPLIGICLGLQLFMSESYEFGRHKGLNLIEGEVVRFDNPTESDGRPLKVPQVGWNRLWESNTANPWSGSLLQGVATGSYMYFVHSYHIVPQCAEWIQAQTRYGQTVFCSVVNRNNIFASQFHPERSGTDGIKIYHNLALRIRACYALTELFNEDSHRESNRHIVWPNYQ
ncbi:MAG: imidazole glycerol phosphate synthase subunit HisH [Caldilineaceae bacterium]